MGQTAIQEAASWSMRCGPGRRPPAPDAGDFLTPEIMRLLGTARRVIDEHVNRQGNCGVCGSSWPCQRAQLAEFTLGSL